MRGDRISKVGAVRRRESTAAQTGGCESPSATNPFTGRELQPRQVSALSVGSFLPHRQLFGNPSLPSPGLQDEGQCVQIHTCV